MIKLILGIVTALSLTANEPTFSTEFGYFIEDILDRNEIVSKYFTTEGFLVGFDKAMAGESAVTTKEELCKYFEPGVEITEERKATYSEACGHYVVVLLKQKSSNDVIYEEIRAGIVEGKSMDELPLLSDETKAKCIELLEDRNES